MHRRSRSGFGGQRGAHVHGPRMLPEDISAAIHQRLTQAMKDEMTYLRSAYGMAPSIAADLIMTHLISSDLERLNVPDASATAASMNEEQHTSLSALDYVEERMRAASFDGSDSGDVFTHGRSSSRAGSSIVDFGTFGGRPSVGSAPYDDEFDARIDFLVRIYGLVS